MRPAAAAAAVDSLRPQEYSASVRDTGERAARVRGYATQRFRSYVPAGVLLPLFVLALATLGAAVVLSGAAETARPGNVAAEASPTPGKVHVRNTLNGEPLIAAVNPLGWALVGGERCSQQVPIWSFDETIVQSTFWPWVGEACDQPGVPSRICHRIDDLCSDEFVFTGEDVTVDIEWAPLLAEAPEHPLLRVRFVHDGSSQPVTLLSWLFKAGTFLCAGGSTEPVTLSTVVLHWPKLCQAPELDIATRFETEEFGVLEGALQWDSGDQTLDVDTGGFLATPTASPSASPTPTPAATDTPPTPASLPETGGAPGNTPRPNTIALAAFGAAVASTASADTTTPSASPTPYPQSMIIVRFVNDGQPVTTGIASTARSADGVECPAFQLGAVSIVSQSSMGWPFVDPSKAPECRKGPPTLLRIEFLLITPANDEGLRLSVEANWEGNDLVLDLNIPDRFVFAAAPTSKGLPSGGGPPGAGSTPAVILIVAGAALLVVSAAVAFSQRPAPPRPGAGR